MPTTILVNQISKSILSDHLKVLGENVFSLHLNGQNLILEVLNIQLAEKIMRIRVKHTTYELQFKDDLDLVLDKMGIQRSANIAQKDLRAPMPGKVIDVLAKEGDKLEKGDNILILEAMKMENVLKAENSCVVRKINIKPLENVEKNQVLVELDF
ncbi:MAG: acetyl-CoA carboxylase biotin carboxyl carrier protein subunit [Crocinitomicaceae bacterium]|nr:acetyl-CoA carboxylase biotin carboxyl carrier protein subunit [Crocinitomicaceae bacterium]MBK8927786.1 acetyl-CoA carboxylase biotin carboxyl carrier protein subunit [Crocinitomicaceae bacterium]